MSIKLDLHVHSESRGKIFITAEQLRKSLRQNNLDGVAITNFSDISHALWLKEKLKEYIIIVGQEIWTKDGHIVGLGLSKNIADFQSAQGTIDHIHEQQGIAIAVHPFLHLGIGKKILSLPIDAIESYNGLIGALVIPNYLAMISARIRQVPHVASTDTTDARFIGRSYTEVIVEDPKLILNGILSGRIRLYKKALPIPITFILKNLLNIQDIEPCLLHAVPCFVCSKSMVMRLLKRKYKCFDCGKLELSRVVCCNNHYFCISCIIRRM